LADLRTAILSRTFVGIGFGPIQSGLFLYEAFRSGNFDRLVVAEVASDVVHAVRQAGGKYTINIALPDRIVAETVDGLEIYNPNDLADQAQLVAAIAESQEIATALPAVEFYDRGDPSPAELLATGLMYKQQTSNPQGTLIYAAENHLLAAEILHNTVRVHIAPNSYGWFDGGVQFVNTVIGKMSGVVDDAHEIKSASLQPLLEGDTRAVLVEEFNHILIERVHLPDFERGLDVFEEKSLLTPFEEAKLYGHNAAHALMGYLAHQRGYELMSEVRDTELMELVERAFIDESGTALCRRHEGIDPLFTEAGWRAYALDLLERMTNPHLRDKVSRIVRDPKRKLGWNDRLIGTLRLAIAQGMQPQLYAQGAAAALAMLMEDRTDANSQELLEGCWRYDETPPKERDAMLALVMEAYEELAFNTRQ
jgi:mannitol-1-phosphate 5-dehydrogenase